MAKYRSPGAGAPNMANLMKQAQKMQEEAARLTEEINLMEFTATSGGGAVKVVVTGEKIVKQLEISPDVVDPEDTEMLSDLIVAALNEALRECEATSSAKMNALSGNMRF